MAASSKPWAYWSPEILASTLQCPLGAVEAHWPRLVEQLVLAGIDSLATRVALLGTVAIETAHEFAPIHEYPDWARYPASGGYSPSYGGGSTYHGRGFLQLTHDYNYRTYGQKVDELWAAGGAIDLVARPDDALDPDISAAVAAVYFRDHAPDGGPSIPQAAQAGDWARVRKLVQGGSAGLGELIHYADVLLATATPEADLPTVVLPAKPSKKVVYDARFPATFQDDDWSCAPSSLDWALRSLGRTPGHSYIENRLVTDGIVSRAQGLLDASGTALAAWIGRMTPPEAYYGGDGFYGNSEPVVTFDGAAQEGSHAYPILIGGRGWCHWVAVRGYDPERDVLLLANPAGDGPTYGGQELTRSQFEARGPFSMVRVLHPDLLTPVEPTPPPDPKAALRAWKEEMRALIDRMPI